MARAGRQVDGAVRRHDPRRGIGLDAHHPRHGIEQLVAGMRMRCDLETRREFLRHRRDRPRHRLVVGRVGAARFGPGEVGWHACIGRLSEIRRFLARHRIYDRRTTRGDQRLRIGRAMPDRDRLHFLLLNVGHFLDHLFTLIFATVAALALSREWGLGYGDLLKYATPGFFAFGVFALPGRLARRQMEPRRHDGRVLRRHRRGLDRDRPSRSTPLQIGIGLFVIGVFAAIYHPVGLAIVVAEVEEHRHAHRRQRRLGQSRRRQRGADHRLFHRQRRLAHGLHRSRACSRSWSASATPALRWREIVRAESAKAATVAAAPSRRGRRQGAAVARVGDRVPDHGGVEHRLPVDDIRTAQGVRRAPAGHRHDAGGWRRAGLPAGRRRDGDRFARLLRVRAGLDGASSWSASLLDRLGPRTVFIAAAAIQVVFFAADAGLADWAALAVRAGLHARRPSARSRSTTT